MSYTLDEIHYQELAKYEPADICRRAQCDYDAAKEAYTLHIWGDEYVVSLRERKVECLGTGSLPHDYFYVFIINYLQMSQKIDLVDEWISEKDIPGGATFFRGPHEIPTGIISRCFDNDLDRFKKRCTDLGGTPLDMADAAYRFTLTPDITLAVLYWIGDEDFPAEAKILYDKSLGEFLALDSVFALAVEACYRIGHNAHP